MIKKITLLSLIAILTLSITEHGNCKNAVYSEKFGTVQDCIDFAKKTGLLMHTGKESQAYDMLHSPDHFVKPYAPHSDKELFIANRKAAMKSLYPEFGKPIEEGFEYIGTVKTGTCLLYVYFLAKYEFSPIPYKFVFYKPEGRWKYADCIANPEVYSDLMFISKRMIEKTHDLVPESK